MREEGGDLRWAVGSKRLRDVEEFEAAMPVLATARPERYCVRMLGVLVARVDRTDRRIEGDDATAARANAARARVARIEGDIPAAIDSASLLCSKVARENRLTNTVALDREPRNGDDEAVSSSLMAGR